MKNTLYIFLSLLLFTLKILAQEQLNFKVLNMDDGLSDNTILSITKGPEGFCGLEVATDLINMTEKP